jgi:hypothetical protein
MCALPPANMLMKISVNFDPTEPIYHVPTTENAVALESFVCHLYIFQFTCSKTRDIRPALISRFAGCTFVARLTIALRGHQRIGIMVGGISDDLSRVKGGPPSTISNGRKKCVRNNDSAVTFTKMDLLSRDRAPIRLKAKFSIYGTCI